MIECAIVRVEDKRLFTLTRTSESSVVVEETGGTTTCLDHRGPTHFAIQLQQIFCLPDDVSFYLAEIAGRMR